VSLPEPDPRAPQASEPAAALEGGGSVPEVSPVHEDGGDEVRPDDSDLDGIEIDILADGTVRLHAQCRPGQDPAECAERIQFLVDALGVPLDSVVTEVTPPPEA
jgi:hypothetical protein